MFLVLPVISEGKGQLNHIKHLLNVITSQQDFFSVICDINVLACSTLGCSLLNLCVSSASSSLITANFVHICYIHKTPPQSSCRTSAWQFTPYRSNIQNVFYSSSISFFQGPEPKSDTRVRLNSAFLSGLYRQVELDPLGSGDRASPSTGTGTGGQAG